MSVGKNSLNANYANALKASNPKTGHSCAPVCPIFCPAAAYILKNEETNPICHLLYLCLNNFYT
jgi:hypothetical protein